MADVAGFLSMRKKKKKKKKKTNAIQLLEQEKALEAENQLSEDDAEENPLTISAMDDVMETGVWVDDDEDDEEPVKEKKFLMSGKSTKEVLDLEEMNPQTEKAPISEESAEIRAEFHRARQQALAAPKKEPVVEAAPAKPRKFVPRQKREQLAKMSGTTALKNMQSEEFFPSLGSTAKAPKKEPAKPSTVWGRVDAKAAKPVSEEETAQAAEPPKYLEVDFIKSDTFDGPKPGYSFKAGSEGTGYYWEGGDEVKQAALKGEEKESDLSAATKQEAGSKEGQEKVTENAKEEESESAPKAEKKEVDGDFSEEFAELAKIKKKKKKKKLKALDEAELL